MLWYIIIVLENHINGQRKKETYLSYSRVLKKLMKIVQRLYFSEVYSFERESLIVKRYTIVKERR